MGRSNFMMRYYKNYKDELEAETKKNLFKPKKWWAYLLFYGYLVFYGYIFWMNPLSVP